jgi:arylsulfatase A-like enzyme
MHGPRFWLMISVILFLPGSVFAQERPKTNIVFLLVDDLGWADVGCFGSKFHETPNIDQLASSGMRFTQGYAACPVCSPTRASIMTGRHPVRVDITDWIPGMATARARSPIFQHVNDRDNLALEEVTIAEALKLTGYQTFFAGKWHLGQQGNWPTDQGFDVNIGGNSRGGPPGGYYSPWKNPTLKSNHRGEYVTERLTAESLKFLETRDPNRPFLLYLSYYNVHTPITPYKKRHQHFIAKAEREFEGISPQIVEHEGQSRIRQDNAAYASMVAAVDHSVGQLMAALKEMKLEGNTAVFFFSDNGGLCTKKGIGPTSNLPLRAGKGWLYEGGVRVPMIIRAPGITEPGSSCSVPVVSMDFFPTILELCGSKPMPLRHRDGASLVPLLGQTGDLPERALYWHYPHYHGSTWTPGASIRDGDWKLIEFYHYGNVELYNLADDPGESTDLSDLQPARRERLLTKLHAWQKKLDAKLPQPK